MIRSFQSMFAAPMLALSLASAAAAQGAGPPPKALIVALYAEPTLTLEAARAASYFARDLDSAIRQDTSNPGEVGVMDFDFRYGAQEVDISGLQMLQEIDNDQARVVVVFKNFGHPQSVNWTLCRRTDGQWRIANAASNTSKDSWDLRDMLRLAADRIRC